MKKFLRLSLFLYLLLQISACSVSQITVRAAMPLIDGGIIAMNRESDLKLASLSIPANISLIEGMLVQDPDNETLRLYAAEAYYGYAFGFVEDGFNSEGDQDRAAGFYQRGFLHAKQVLIQQGLDRHLFDASLKDLQDGLLQLDKKEVPALFWTASCLAKFIDLNRDKAQSLAQLPKAVMLMQRVLDLDEHFYMSGAHIFFGVYYGSKSPMLGGNYQLSEQHFELANQANHNKLLVVNLLRAQYLERQRFAQQKFHKLLNNVIQASDELYPEQALINQISKHKASLLIQKEDLWF
ncbi:MAG: TRAP transporter TatT component family protein [gamma proteobacterium symbiont of Taylorina sp.]|nr:TRAP transporter TatT component family protein [gamma proteobacterium symbiont of Taylorina sp.]